MNRKENLKQIQSLTASVQLPPLSLQLLHQAAGRTRLSFRVRSCCAPIFTTAFTAESVRCQCLLTPYPHPAAAPSSESAPDACRPGSFSFINCKSLQLHWLQELLRAAHQLETCLCKSLGMSCPSSSASSWPRTRVSFFLLPEPISTPPEA